MVRQMNGKITILNIELDRLSAKEAMYRAVQYIENESVSTVEIVTMDMLLRGQERPEWKQAVQTLDMVIPGEQEILEAAGISDKGLIRDTSGQTFLKMFMRYLQKNKKKVFLVAQTEEELTDLETLMREYDRHLLITGHGILPADGTSEETVINEINGAEADCIFSLLPSPEQELFIARNSALLNVRIFFGCGDVLKENYLKQKKKARIQRFFRKKVFRYLAGRQKKDDLS